MKWLCIHFLLLVMPSAFAKPFSLPPKACGNKPMVVIFEKSVTGHHFYLRIPGITSAPEPRLNPTRNAVQGMIGKEIARPLNDLYSTIIGSCGAACPLKSTADLKTH